MLYQGLTGGVRGAVGTTDANGEGRRLYLRPRPRNNSPARRVIIGNGLNLDSLRRFSGYDPVRSGRGVVPDGQGVKK